MGYIGNQPAEKFSSFSKQTFSPDGSSTSFTLDYAVSGENELALFINNVRQEPGSGKAYTASGTTLTMSEAPGSSDTMYGIFIGKAVQTVTPNLNPITIDSGTVATFNRTTSDGNIIELQKDGTAVGSIGAESDDLYIESTATNHSGIRFLGASLRPRYNGATSDNVIDIGSSTMRFNDLYLGGNIYLGGTTSANALDDYEEGTWTPVFLGGTTNPTLTYTAQEGKYRKVGNLVYFDARIVSGTVSSSGSGNLRIGGLPFTSSSNNARGFAVHPVQNMDATMGYVQLLESGGTYYILRTNTDGDTQSELQTSALGNSKTIHLSGMYTTN